jgi:hypothetical protein
MGMRALLSVVLMLCLALSDARAAGTSGLEIEVRDNQVTIRAQKVPLNKILDRLAQQTGMKLTYEGTPPSQPVTATLEGLPVRDAVVRLMEGLAVPYVFGTDVGGRRVVSLLIPDASGTSTASSSSSMASQEAIEYPTEVIEDVPEYEEPEIPQPIPGVIPELTGGQPPLGTPAQDLALPNMGAGPGFPNQQPNFPGPVSNPFPR